MKVQIALLVGLACYALAAPVIDPEVLKSLGEKGTTTVFVSFRNSNTAGIRSTFTSLKTTLSTRAAKLNLMYNLLKDHADTTQGKVRAFLDSQKATKSGLRISQSWMTNELIIRGIDKETIVALQGFADVKEIRADRLIPWTDKPTPVFHTDAIVPNAQWGVDKVRAPAVWEQRNNTGAGVVVMTIDTGVRGTHEAVRNNHRELNGWFDPAEGDSTPTDNDGHGTHTMGTIAGQTNGVGVAPGAQWIACKGCGYFGCYLSDLTDCGNFAGCPTDVYGTNARCELAPSLVSNSWGGGQGDAFFDEIIATWKAVDIAPLFSIGNSGSGCGTANSPGDSIDAIGVGSTTAEETISSFSSRGPTYRGQRIKPEISAPGSAVISSYNTADDAYATLSGTSMACPHIAGISALIYAENPTLSYDGIKAALIGGAQRTIASTGANCGSVREDTYPNHVVGHGRADALASLNIAKNFV
jgi:hypothetical protein